jgi:hypothetical protein
MTNRFRPRYAVNVRIIDNSGSPDPRFDEFESLPLPDTGVFHFPDPGTIVTVIFINGSPDQPRITSISTEKRAVPALQPGEVVISQSYDTFVRFEANGDIRIQTSGKIIVDALEKHQSVEFLHNKIGTRKTEISGDDDLIVDHSLTHESTNYTRVTSADSNVVVLQNEQRLTTGERSEGIGSLKRTISAGEETIIVAGGSITDVVAGDYEVTLISGTHRIANQMAKIEINRAGQTTIGTETTSLSVSDSEVDVT